MKSAVFRGAVAAVALAFPFAAICALVYRFPIPFSGYESGLAAVPAALVAVMFYGVLGGVIALIFLPRNDAEEAARMSSSPPSVLAGAVADRPDQSRRTTQCAPVSLLSASNPGQVRIAAPHPSVERDAIDSTPLSRIGGCRLLAGDAKSTRLRLARLERGTTQRQYVD